MRHFIVQIREVGRSHIIESEYKGEIDRKGIIEFYGLKQPDVEWYNIIEVTDKDNEQI
ncbi:MAG: hypothetical protein NC411_01190 [Bacteroides sp.]|nr:hypothetical protein [Bacteroides sp.]